MGAGSLGYYIPALPVFVLIPQGKDLAFPVQLRIGAISTTWTRIMSFTLEQLFPAPSLPPSQLSPQRFPGANLESLAALQDVLKDNHQRYHIFFNDLLFHNHVTHRALGLYALGGSAAIIRDYFKLDGKFQRPAIQSPEPITGQNFFDHLGDEKCYNAYVSFFSKQISEKGATRTLEEFVFSEKYNFQEGRDANTQPEMLGRLFAGLLHPLIHVGYGLEFGLKGMLVEGLALTAVHVLRVRGTLPPSFLTPDGVDSIVHPLLSLTLDTSAVANTPVSKTGGGVHAFDIVASVIKDERLKRRAPADIANNFGEVLAEYAPVVREHVAKWTVDLNKPGEIERKMEEVVWVSSLVYGVGGLSPDGFKANFFLMHCVTSSIFLPSFIPYLTPRSQVLLLRGYLFTVLTLWVMLGRPVLDIKSFMATTSVEPSVPTSPAPKAPLTTETTATPNPFLPILQSAITHPNDHLVKIQRAFAHFDTLYGKHPAGYFGATELEDAGLLDGSLFLRAALLTADYVGWVREGKEPRPFTHEV